MKTSLPREKNPNPYIFTKSCNFVLYFGNRLLTDLSLSCTILMIAYLNLTTPIYRYCVWHSGSEPFALCLALDRHWLCYSTNEQPKKSELPALKVLTVRFFPFIRSMDSFLNNLGEGRTFEACLTAVTAFPAMYSELSWKKIGQQKHTHLCLKMGCGIWKNNMGWRNISLNFSVNHLLLAFL